MTAYPVSQSSLTRESLVFAGRLFTNWRRGLFVPIQALLYPSFLLITYYLLVGKSLTRITGTDTLYGLVPACAVVGAMMGAMGAALTIPLERDRGLLSQLWVLPVHRSSALAGRLIADAARTLLGTGLVTAVGVGLGLRFHGNWLAVVPFLLVPVLVDVVFATAVIAIAVRSRRGSVLIWIGLPAISAVFASSGAPPVEMLPSWMRPLILAQPMSPTIASMRALAEGGPVAWPLLLTFIWGLGLAIIAVPMAVRGYRAAAESAG